MRRRGWLWLALALPLVGLAFLHAVGARAWVGALSGTLPGGRLELGAGLLYVLAWFAAVVVAPVVALALLLDRACGTLLARAHRWRALGRR